MKIKELRENKNKSQNDMAIALGIKRATYGNYENEITQPDISILKKLAEYYQTSLDYLCDFNPPYQLTLPPLTEEQKKAIQILLKLPLEIFYYMFAKLEGYQEQYKIQI